MRLQVTSCKLQVVALNVFRLKVYISRFYEKEQNLNQFSKFLIFQPVTCNLQLVTF